MPSARVSALLVLALALSSCDLFGGLEIASPAQVFTIPPYERTTIDLVSELGIESEPNLAFRVEDLSGSVTGSIQFPDALAVTPTGIGPGTITVRALLGASDAGTATLQFEVEDPGPLPALDRVVISRDGRYDLDVAQFFRPVPETDYVVLSTQGPVQAAITGQSLLSVFPTDTGDGSVTVTTTRFAPQRLVVPVRIVASEPL